MSTRYDVFQHDNVFRFRIRSRSRADIEHVVDVSSNRGIGECSCEHFQFRLQPAITAGLTTAGRHACRCSHILAAREACLDALIQRITAAEREYYAPPIDPATCSIEDLQGIIASDPDAHPAYARELEARRSREREIQHWEDHFDDDH